MKYKIITAILTLLFVVAVAPSYGGDDVYYCADIDGNGFHPDKKDGSYSYRRSGFNGERFKIKLDLPNKKIKMANSDENDKAYTCTQPYSSIGNTSLSCINDFYMFNFNPDTGRYVIAMGYGYVVGDSDSVAVRIGKCDKF